MADKEYVIDNPDNPVYASMYHYLLQVMVLKEALVITTLKQVACVLGGTVGYGQGATLSRSFSVGFSGSIQALHIIYMVQNLEQYSSRRG